MKKIRVLVIDDSAYNRRTISKILEGLPGIAVVGYATDGEEGMRKIIDLKPDLITLDLEMPKIDGFTLLRFIMAHRPTPVIVVSSHSGSEGVFKALELGAVDFVVKPSPEISTELQSIRADLEEKVRNVSALKVRGMASRQVQLPQGEPAVHNVPSAGRRSTITVDVVAIGASTGGPPALQTILTALPADFPVPIVISQHMPATFTGSFAQRLDRVSPLSVREARGGERLEKGMVLVAPGGYNLLLEKDSEGVVAKIVQPTSRYRYIPSVDAMFESCSQLYGGRVLGVVLTGMGNDGRKGGEAIKGSGGTVIAESEESAVVYGMPREVVAAGVADRVVPLPRIAAEISGICLKGRYSHP